MGVRVAFMTSSRIVYILVDILLSHSHTQLRKFKRRVNTRSTHPVLPISLTYPPRIMHCVSKREQERERVELLVILLSQTIGEHEQRAVIDPQSINDPEVVKLQRILIDWINDELAEQRIIVQQLDEDMYDGQVLHKLWEKLTGKKLDVPEVTQSEQGQHEKLNIVLKAVNHVSFTKQP